MSGRLRAALFLFIATAHAENYTRPAFSPTLPLDQLRRTSLDPSQPEQIRLTHTTRGMRVTWITTAESGSPVAVRFGTDPTNMISKGADPDSRISSCACKACGGNYTSGRIYTSLLSPLNASTTYHYQISGQPHPASFTTVPGPELHPFSFGLTGDLGQTSNSNNTVSHLMDSAAGMILHAGDLSYADGFQPRWDSYGRMVERLSSSTPWMTVAGNHEVEDRHKNGCGGGTFVAYNDRYGHAMPFRESNSTSFQFYSIEVAGAHIMMLGSYTKSSSVDKSLYAEQLAWVESDLRTVNRTKTPWLFAVLHAPWYNSNSHHQHEKEELDMSGSLEEMFFEAKLDAMFAGHVHAYERSRRVFKKKVNKCGATYINIGDGGNREGLAIPYLAKPDSCAYREASFGHGLLSVVNESHTHFTWHRDQDGERTVGDDLWLVKDKTC